jgi:hypothetical protein
MDHLGSMRMHDTEHSNPVPRGRPSNSNVAGNPIIWAEKRAPGVRRRQEDRDLLAEVERLRKDLARHRAHAERVHGCKGGLPGELEAW